MVFFTLIQIGYFFIRFASQKVPCFIVVQIEVPIKVIFKDLCIPIVKPQPIAKYWQLVIDYSNYY
jgi:hypothetical protein